MVLTIQEWKRAALLMASVALAGGMGQVARGVVTGNAAANTTGVYSGTSTSLDGTTVFGFDHVGQMHEGSVVYLGNGWILTAQHVNGGQVTMDDGLYQPSTTYSVIYQSNSISSNSSVDLKVLLLAPNATGVGLPNFSPMPLATASPALGTQVTLVGYGATNAGLSPSYYSVNTTNPNNYVWSGPFTTSAGHNVGGFQNTAPIVKRWGLDTTTADSTSPGTPTFNYTDPTSGQVYTFLEMPFFTDPKNSYLNATSAQKAVEASFASGDSGGGLFANGRLVGIADQISTYNNQPLSTPTVNSTMFGNLSLPEDVATYAATILTSIKQGQWNATGGGAWSSANWYGYVPDSVGASADFGDTITTNAAVTIAGSITLANFDFNTTSSVTVSGGAITVSYPDPTDVGAVRYAMFNTYAGTHTVASPLTLVSLSKLQVYTVAGALVLSGGMINATAIPIEKIGTGALTISGVQSQAAGTVLTISAGKVVLNADLGSAGNTNVQVNLNSTVSQALTIGSTQHLAGLNLAAGTSVLVNPNGNQMIVLGASNGTTGGLVMTGSAGNWGGKINLNDNDLVLSYADAASAAAGLTAINSMLAQGRNSGAWTGAAGIISSSAAAAYTAHGNTEYTTLAAVLATDLVNNPDQTWQGENLPANAVVVKYTYVGDATVDGVLNIDDFLATENGYLRHLTGWANGDFNRDGTVDAADLTLLGNAFASQGGPLNDQLGLELLAQAALSPETLPEPSSLGMLVMGAGMLLRRRAR